MLKKNPIIDEAASTIYSISQDSIMLEKIRAREEAIAHENYMKKQMEEQARQLNEKDKQLNVQSKQLNEKDKQLDEKDKQLDEKDRQLNVQSKQLNEKDKQLDEKDALIARLLRENEELRRNK